MADTSKTLNPFSSENTGEVKTSYISGSTFGLKEVTYIERNGEAIFEGDIILGNDEELQNFKRQIEDPNLAGAVAIPGMGFRWPGGIINYRIDPSLPDQQRVTDAIRHLEANTNLRFRLRTMEANFITFRNSDSCKFTGRDAGW